MLLNMLVFPLPRFQRAGLKLLISLCAEQVEPAAGLGTGLPGAAGGTD